MDKERRGRWNRNRPEEEEQQSGDSAVSPTAEQRYSTFGEVAFPPRCCKCAPNCEQSKSARQRCQKPLGGTSPARCQCREATLQIQIAGSLACSLAKRFRGSWHRRHAYGGPRGNKGSAFLDTYADPFVPGHLMKFCCAIFHTLIPTKKRLQD